MAVEPFSQSPTSVPDAHAVRSRPVFVPDLADDYDRASDDIIRTLLGGVRFIDLDGLAVIEGRFIDGRVRLRLDGRSWSMPPIETSLLALRIRLTPGIVAAHKIADALQRAVQIAETRVAAVHDWSAGVRPTQDVE
ncbi:MAG: hypothetical protein ACK4M2_01585 [Brevundimonas sp.]